MSSTGSQTPRSIRSRKQVNHSGMIRSTPNSRRRMSNDLERPAISQRKRKESDDTEADSDNSVVFEPARKKRQLLSDSDNIPNSSVQPTRKKKKSSSQSQQPRKKKKVDQASLPADVSSFFLSHLVIGLLTVESCSISPQMSPRICSRTILTLR